MTVSGRLHAALLELVKSNSIKHRLAAAFSAHLKDLDPAELPAELREQFCSLAAELESVRPLPGESAVQATVRKMSCDQADRCASRIVDLYREIANQPPSVTRLHGRDKREEAVPRLLAAEG